MRHLLWIAQLAVVVGIAGPSRPVRAQVGAQPKSLEALAEEAYTFAFSMLENYRPLVNAFGQPGTGTVDPAQLNRFRHRTQLLDASVRNVVRPNNDTLYSIALLDLRSEPIVVHLPAIAANRYWSLHVMDLYTHNPAIFSPRTVGAGSLPGDFLIAGPDWQGAASTGIRHIVRLETRLAVIIVRVAVYGPGDVPQVVALQGGMRITPLHVVAERPAPAAAAVLRFPVWSPAQASGAGFVHYLNFLLNLAQIHADERALIAGWAPLGVAIAPATSPPLPSGTALAAVERGIAAAMRQIDEGIPGARQSGVWTTPVHAFGNRDRIRGQYVLRGAAAKALLWGLDDEEATYTSSASDAEGAPLTGAGQGYRLRFERGQFPPAHAFWSLTVYGPDGYFVPNAIDRYSIGDRTPGLKYGEDGSLTLYLGAAAPGGEMDANWLPVPTGPFSLTLRMYYPVDSEGYVPPAPRRGP